MEWYNVLPWLVPVPPFIACLLILVAVGRNRHLSRGVALVGISLSLVMSWALVWHAIGWRDLGINRVIGSTLQQILGSPWLSNGTGKIEMGVLIDPATSVMLFMVPFACTMIFIYAIGYMEHDPRQARFFAYLSLFAGAMLTLVVADNLLMLFIGWEVMGLCSYLLIGFWYEKKSAYKAAMKAFMTTRVADVIMMIGIAYLWAATGTLNFREILHNEEVLKFLATVQPGAVLGVSAATIIGICLVIGTMGKSAQFPFHVWLPDAMEGPTPVSAMIHAAAMVSAGVYLLIRMYPVITAGSNFEEGLLTPPVILMGVVGAFTALFAASIAITQNDIKKVMAYSTISQLGFMIAALGIGAWGAAIFHLITHAFFKALLFLGSGAVIHAVEHGHHHVSHAHGHDDHGDAHGDAHAAHADDHGHSAHDGHDSHDGHDEHDSHVVVEPTPAVPEFDPQDMRNMGGLWKRIPVTAVCYTIGGAALAGFPFITAGFWSKDEIILDAIDKMGKTPLAIFVFVCLALAAILTAFYTTRQLIMVFLGKPRTEAAEHAMLNDGTTEGRNISWQLQAPLIALAFFAVVAGWAGINPYFWPFGGMVRAVGRLFGDPNLSQPFILWTERALLEAPPHPVFTPVAPLVSVLVFGIGLFFGYMLYGRKEIKLGEADAFEAVVGPQAYRVIQNKYYIDEFYANTLIRPLQWFADKVVGPIIDQGIIDGILNAVAAAARWIGEFLREFNRIVIDGVGDGIPALITRAGQALRIVQSGQIQQYLLFALLASLLIGGNIALFVLAPANAPTILAIQAVVVVVVLILFGSSSARSSSEQ